MKKYVIGVFLILTLVFVISVISAKTLIAGKIYNADYSDTIADAWVNVTCKNTTNSTESVDDGTYSVVFEEDDCNYGGYIEVFAGKGDLTGWNNGTVSIDKTTLGLDVNVGVVNVALIPEFGVIIGILTILSAFGIFFVIRKK